MFVKIKLEDEGNAKVPHIFEIKDTATVYNLKTHLESFVGISADEQEIKTLDRTLGNCDKLDKVVNQEIDGNKMNGAAISLYKNKKFHCFLQFYNRIEGGNQTNFFRQPPDAKKFAIDQVPPYFEYIVETSEAWYSTASEMDSSDSTNSSTSSDSIGDALTLKRTSTDKSNSPVKRSRPVAEPNESDCEPTSTAVMLPLKEANQTSNISEHETRVLISESVSEVSVTSPSPEIPSEGQQIEITVVEKAPEGSSTLGDIANHNFTVPLKLDSAAVQSAPAAPYIIMKPEHRKYAVVISNNVDEQNPAYSCQLEHLCGLFESSRICERLNFSEYASISVYGDKMWVLCEDKETYEWITTGVGNLYECSSLIKYYGLLKCSMVLPQVVESKQLSNIFHLLELQNPGLCTHKWCVVERSMLDPESAAKAVTTLCKNEQLILYVDKDSKCYIEQHSCRLKYCFWKLTFDF
ncbi:uncharacterized protein LOC6568179 [Drosophila grimshawi]|uniref:GH17337 n=1 Tax=Drosophila grimshawi TaxID=7222 RepID=B4JUS5_DROGR|nr:uncharacterized protein LOC6568179 [Drosophila grimshawi]EDV91245.1 GH17337 [Drosophila grimshawi]